jgi:surfeit locus 1 family protein
MSSTPAEAGRVFRPRLWPTLATLVGVALLLSLGTWQLQRLAWKRGLIEHAQSQLAAAPVPLPDAGLENFDFRRVSVTGRYLHDAAFAFGFTAEDGAPGSRLITPFRLEDGRVILVDRGWLPTELLPPHVPKGLEPSAKVTLDGIGRWLGSWHRTWLTPDASPTEHRWYGWDIPAMAEATGLPLEPVEVVLERSEGPAGLPKAEPVSVDLPNNHFGYAMTWYGLALALVVIYLLFSTTRSGSARS